MNINNLLKFIDCEIQPKRNKKEEPFFLIEIILLQVMKKRAKLRPNIINLFQIMIKRMKNESVFSFEKLQSLCIY